MRLNRIKVGDAARHTYTVPRSKTVPYLYSESTDYQLMPEVFATGYMVGLLEWAAIIALRPVLEQGEGSLGTMVNIRHSAPTPPGARLCVTATCTKILEHYLEWDVSAVDDLGTVAASGAHGRNVIETDRFLARVRALSVSLGCPSVHDECI